MAKYHINSKGIPALCKASIKNCPLGGANEHFDTYAEAEKVSEERLMKQYILNTDDDNKNKVNNIKDNIVNSYTLKQETYHDKNSTEYHQHLTEALQDDLIKFGYGHRAGLLGECYASTAYSQDKNLQNTITFNNQGLPVNKLQSNTGNINDKDIKYINHLKKNINNKLHENGLHNTDNSLIRAIHYSDDYNTSVVQMGAPNMPDIALIKDNNVEFVEVKDLHTSNGSQIDSTSSEVGKHGLPVLDMQQYPKKVQDNLKMAGFNKTIGKNYTLNSLTYHDSLEYFISEQQKQGVSHFAYIGRDNKLHDISLKDKQSVIADKLQQNNINGTLIMRSNQITGKPTQNTLKHWKNDRASLYFKNGQWPHENKIKLHDFKFKKGQISIMKNHLCIGEMVLPVKIDKIENLNKINFNRTIDLSQVKARQMTFTGHLFQTN